MKVVGYKSLFWLLVVSTLFLRLFRLWYPDTYYFDEVYHAFTAEAYAVNDPRGYEWWNSAPQGLAYEWLHPPLAKLIQAISINLFGDTPFAWRFPGVLFGTGIGILLYHLGKKIFNSERIGLIAFFLASFDGLLFTSSRITMNDIYLAFWVILAVYWLLSSKSVFLVGLALGLAVATKWTGVYALGMVGLVWFVRGISQKFTWQKLLIGFISFSILPALIYLASYSQFFLQGHTVGQFKELHQQIWWYQTNLKATHPYQSTPWEWMLGLRPLYAFTSSVGDKTANIYLMGNPAVGWAGLVAVIFAFFYLVARRLKGRLANTDLSLAVVFLGYLAMFLPWTISPRIMFVYHYVPALPFLCLITAWAVDLVWEKNKQAALLYLFCVLTLFIYFYPHWTAIPVSGEWDRQYYWLSSWR